MLYRRDAASQNMAVIMATAAPTAAIVIVSVSLQFHDAFLSIIEET
jgi:hypothetical protein